MATSHWRGIALAALLTVAGLTSCTDDDSGSNDSSAVGVYTPLNWVPTNTGPTGSNADTPLLWNDPNTAPIPGGGGATGEITFEDIDPVTYAGNQHPVCTPQAQNINEEYAITGQVVLYRNSQQQGGGIGGGVVTILPTMIFNNAKLAEIERAWCKHITLHNPPNEPMTLAQAMTICGSATNQGVEYVAQGQGINATQAWGMMGAPAQNRAVQGGYCSGGFWSDLANPALNVYGLLFTIAAP